MTSPTPRDQHFKNISLSGEGRRDNTLHTQTTHTYQSALREGRAHGQQDTRPQIQTDNFFLVVPSGQASSQASPALNYLKLSPSSCHQSANLGKAELPSSTGARILTLNNFTTANNTCPLIHRATRNGLAQLNPAHRLQLGFESSAYIKWVPCACALRSPPEQFTPNFKEERKGQRSLVKAQWCSISLSVR